MHQKGDEKVVDNKTFIYVGYDEWEEKPTSTSQKSVQEQLLAELDKKADLTETQPVSVASLPLPAGAATAARQDLLLAELQLKADLTETQPVSLATLPVKIDLATNSITTVDYPHHEIHGGSHYFYTDSVELDNAATQNYLFTTPDTTKWIHLTYVATGSAITQIQLYEGADRTGTTLQTVYNNNRNSLNTAGMTVHKDISAGTTDGTLIEQLKSGSSSAQSRAATTAERSNELILKQNTKYLLRFTSGTNDNLCNLQLSWYEHTSLNI